MRSVRRRSHSLPRGSASANIPLTASKTLQKRPHTRLFRAPATLPPGCGAARARAEARLDALDAQECTLVRRMNHTGREISVVGHPPDQRDIEGHPAEFSAARRGGGGRWGRPWSGPPRRTARGAGCCSRRALPDYSHPLARAGAGVGAQRPRALSSAAQLRAGDGGRAVRVPTPAAGAGETAG